MKPRLVTFLAAALFWVKTEAQHISDFISVPPGAQTQQFRLPSGTHVFQYLLEDGDALSLGGNFPTNPDFTGFVPIAGSSTLGYLSVNSEAAPTGNVSVLNIHFDATLNKWLIDASGLVDFAPVEGTRTNCSGGVTPWGTILSCEENKSDGTPNAAGYFRYGYCVEINPASRSVANYPDGLPGGDKVWKMGFCNHENAAVRPGNTRVLYTGMDEPAGHLFKFVTDSPGDLSAGKLYVLKKTTATDGQWKLLQNSTPAQVNATISQAVAVGAQAYNGIEDVEIGPDGKVYFAVKNESSVYRFTDTDPLCLTDSCITDFETYVGGAGATYDIETAGGIVSAAWGTGNDNLCFDNLGNLWVLQDGSDNAIWVVMSGHTQGSPQVKYFGNAPLGAEPTGITLSPDNKFLFMSVQHPSLANDANQLDAFGTPRDFNKGVTLVVARTEFLGSALPVELLVFDAKAARNSIKIDWRTEAEFGISRFVVERMNERLGPWEPVGSVAATSASGYFFTDENPFVGGNYYRLRLVGLDGRSWLSDVQIAYFYPANRATGGQIFPNPSRDGELFIKLDYPAEAELTAAVVDALGIERLRRPLGKMVDGGFRLDVGGLAAGCYFLEIRAGREAVMSGRFAVE